MKTIIVGIDGSHAAITAALWGVDEAISRAVPLRLVSVIKPTHPSPDDYDRDLAHAERSLREAQSAVEAAGKLVKIETDIPRGPAGPVLVEASRDAEMICVGSVGIGRYASSILGSTATELAEKAHCPVAVMRSKVDQPASDILADHDERVQLAVIGGGEAGQLARLVGPSGHPVFRHAECSVLVVRR